MKSVIVGYKVQKLLEGKNKDPSLVMNLCNMQPNRVHNIHLTTLQTLSFKRCVTISRARQLQIAHTSLLQAEDYHLPELCIEKAKYIREQVMILPSLCVLAYCVMLCKYKHL